MSGTPAFVLKARLDILIANALGLPPLTCSRRFGETAPNNARFAFLDPHATEFFREWDKVANDIVVPPSRRGSTR
jgi:MmyB-like transcription regulator ligand binding domain